MKLAFISDEVSQDLAVSVALATQYGVDGLEIRTVNNKGPFELSSEEVRGIRAALDTVGLEAAAVCSPFFKCDMDDAAEVGRHIAGLARCIGHARLLGTRLIRGFAFWRCGALDALLPQIAARLEMALPLLEANDMLLLLESDPETNLSSGEDVGRLLQYVHSPNIQAVWDPGNNLYSSTGERPYPEGYAHVKPYVRHVHLKDATRRAGEGAVGCRLGDGALDTKGQLAALRRDGYGGYLSLEPHYRHGARLSAQQMALPGGAAFSQDGYAPMEECILALKAMLEDA